MTIPFPHPASPENSTFESLYGALRTQARRLLNRERQAQSMSATMLVHEAWLALARSRNLQIADSAHFVRLASRLMKNLLIDRARRRRATVNGGELQRIEWCELKDAAQEDSNMILAVAAAMEDLAVRSPQLAELVELRYFAGFTEEEVAQIMGICSRTVRRQWRVARLRLLQSMKAAR